MEKITVLLAEDHDIVREGLRLLLELNGDFNVVGEAKNGHEAILLAQEFQPNVIVMDIAMPMFNGFEATRKIRIIAPASKILILSAHADDEYVERMLAEGVAGYLVKQNSGQILIEAIKQIAKGQPFFSQSIAKRLHELKLRAHERGGATTARQVHSKLTAREAEVLQLVAEGNANKQIAALLGISIKTVEKHRQQLMDKLNIHETAGLTRHAIATGVIESCTQGTTE
ncbi:MAG: DNA-binding NarL/FixJ family response regulator [Zhongshania aliphaticivorans]|jgi:DNA-binding NarL/FixJ family response regulator